MRSPAVIALFMASAVLGLSTQGAEAGMLMQCLTENGALLSDVMKLLANGEADQNVKCATKCAMVSINAADDQGNCNIEGLKSFHSESLHDKIGVCCEGASSIPDPCEKVYSYQMCMRKADMEQLKKNWEALTKSQ